MITICSVYHSLETKKLVEMNYELTKRTNPETDFFWILADNTPPDFDSKDGIPKDGRFLIVPGPEGGLQKMYTKYPNWIASTFLHNTAINIAFKNAKTRFVLSLDCDFYILQKDWIKKTLEHMQKNNLTFLGTSWHPKDYQKFRYFPCHQCLFVDSERLRDAGYKLEDLDFNPVSYGERQGTQPQKKFGAFSRAVNMFNFSYRRKIGSDKHTAHGVFEKFYKNPRVKFEIIPSVFKPQKESYPTLNLIYGLNKAFEFFLPDRLCYIPKDPSYYSSKDFKERGFKEGLGEEFLWKDKPFATHVRIQKKLKRGMDQEFIVSRLSELFEYFLRS